MREDHLSPELGRLIDAAKAAAGDAELGTTAVEAVALLTASGVIFSATHVPVLVAECDPGSETLTDAATEALGQCIDAGHEDIDAAAIAVSDTTETVSPCSQCFEVLMDIDPKLPLLVKRQGRWVILPVDEVAPIA